jgi:hypothetical protein
LKYSFGLGTPHQLWFRPSMKDSWPRVHPCESAHRRFIIHEAVLSIP